MDSIHETSHYAVQNEPSIVFEGGEPDCQHQIQAFVMHGVNTYRTSILLSKTLFFSIQCCTVTPYFRAQYNVKRMAKGGGGRPVEAITVSNLDQESRCRV